MDLVKIVAKEANLTNAEAKDAIDAAFTAIHDALLNDDNFTIENFCSFTLTDRQAREGRNPATAEKIVIPATKSMKVKISPSFKKELKAKYSK